MVKPPNASRAGVARVRRGARAALAITLLVAANAPSRAFAEPTAQEKVSAREIFNRGTEKRKTGDLQGAYRDYRAADAIMGVPTTALKLAEVELELGHLVEAHESLERAVRYTQATPMSEPFAQAQQLAHALRDKTRKRLPSLSVVVTGPRAADDERVVVTLDGHTIARAARTVPFFVDPGHHVVVLSADGKVAQERELTVAEGQSTSVSLVAPAAPPEPPPPTATTSPLPAVAPDVPPKSRLGHPLVIGGAVVTGVGLAVGTVAGIMTLGRVSDARTSCPENVCPPSQYGTLDAGQTTATVSTTAFIVAGVGAVVAVGAYFLAPRRPGAPASSTAHGALENAALGRVTF